MIEQMLQTSPEKRPTVDELIKIPKINLRIHERKKRDELQRLIAREGRLERREKELQAR